MDLRPSERESLSPISIRLLRVLFSPRGLLKRARHVVWKKKKTNFELFFFFFSFFYLFAIEWIYAQLEVSTLTATIFFFGGRGVTNRNINTLIAFLFCV